MATVIRTLVYTGEPDRIANVLANSAVRPEAPRMFGAGLTIQEIKRETGTVLHRWWFIRSVATGEYIPEGQGGSWFELERLGRMKNRMPRRFASRRGATGWITQWLRGQAVAVTSRDHEMVWTDPYKLELRPEQTLDPNGMFLWTARPERKREQLDIVSVDVLLP